MSRNRSPRFVSRLTRDTLALIMAGGRGSRLKHDLSAIVERQPEMVGYGSAEQDPMGQRNSDGSNRLKLSHRNKAQIGKGRY